ncbi:MAG: hypothetical protein O2807_00410 [bacterium]|nr:hypothetical protein [bacterium]
MMIRHIGHFSVLALALFLAAGCATYAERRAVPESEYQAAIQGHPPYLHRLIRELLEEGKRNQVLNWNNIALTAMRRGDHSIAKRYFDLSIREINTIFANTESANRARSLWFKEDIKDFKGDPYERAMVFFYRGILYYRDGELDNARAAFRSGQIQDAFAEESQHRSDFAVFDYLEGRITQKIDSPENARENFIQMKKLRNYLKIPKLNENLLILATTNRGPVKYLHSKEDHIVKFAVPRPQIQHVVVFRNQVPVRSATWVDDLGFQATTRGGRAFDHILKGKVQFKNTTRDIGVASIATGTALANAANQSRDQNTRGALAIAALAAYAIGGTASVLSGMTQTGADTRTWRTLPGRIYLWSGELPPGRHQLEFRYYKERLTNARLKSLLRGKPSNTQNLLLVIAPLELRQYRRFATITIHPDKKDHILYASSPNALSF